MLKLEKLIADFTICKVGSEKYLDLNNDFYFIAKTGEELSLVCKTSDVPDSVIEREDGWKAFKIQGILDFSLIGILSQITGILAKNDIGVFAVSTFNTDYVLVKKENFRKTEKVFKAAGFIIVS